MAPFHPIDGRVGSCVEIQKRKMGMKLDRNKSKDGTLCTQGYGLKNSETLHTTMETCKNMLGHEPASN